MDLKEFYFQNVQQNEYHYRFYSSIKNVNNTYNIFSGYEDVNGKYFPAKNGNYFPALSGK